MSKLLPKNVDTKVAVGLKPLMLDIVCDTVEFVTSTEAWYTTDLNCSYESLKKIDWDFFTKDYVIRLYRNDVLVYECEGPKFIDSIIFTKAKLAYYYKKLTVMIDSKTKLLVPIVKTSSEPFTLHVLSRPSIKPFGFNINVTNEIPVMY